MIVTFTFDYYTAVTPEEAAALRTVLRGSPDIPTKEQGDTKYVHYGNYIGELEEVMRAAPRLIPSLKLAGSELTPTSFEYIMKAIRDLSDRVGSLSSSAGGDSFNSRVNVHVPGLGLLMINEIEVKNNCCTEEIQEKLTDGWRILAICPQPDQRRPDYIIGRSVNA